MSLESILANVDWKKVDKYIMPKPEPLSILEKIQCILEGKKVVIERVNRELTVEEAIYRASERECINYHSCLMFCIDANNITFTCRSCPEFKTLSSRRK